MTPTTGAGGEAGVTGYEALRALALGSRSDTPAGLLVLLGKGVAAWMARCLPSPEPPPPTPPSLLVDRRHADLVRVLASMALATGKEARA